MNDDADLSSHVRGPTSTSHNILPPVCRLRSGNSGGDAGRGRGGGLGSMGLFDIRPLLSGSICVCVVLTRRKHKILSTGLYFEGGYIVRS